MPRIKPPRSQEPPPTEDVLVEDHSPPTEDIEIVLAPDEPAEVVVDVAPTRTEPAKPAPSDDDAMVRAADATRRAETLQRENAELVRQNRERNEELTRERSRGDEAEYNSVLTAIAAEQGSLGKAKADYAAAAAAGDWNAAGDAQQAIAQATNRLDRLEDGKQSFESRRETRPAAEARPAAPQTLDFEQKITALPDPAKEWLRKHPEFINDDALNRKIGATHNYLVDNKGVTAFTPAYFDALDSEFGFKSESEPQPQPQPQRRSIPMSAPVSRDVPTASGQRQSDNKMTLTAEERQTARLSIPDTHGLPPLSNAQKELIYAKNKQKLNAMKANGTYSERKE